MLVHITLKSFFLPFSLGKKFILTTVIPTFFCFVVGGHAGENLSHMLVGLVTDVIRVLDGTCYYQT